MEWIADAHRQLGHESGQRRGLARHGVVRKEDVLELCVDGKPIELQSVLRPAPMIPARASVLDALNQFKRHAAELAVVVDGQGRFAGVVTRTDLLEAIAGEFPDEGE